jgi:NAD(P)-dependent dehydrogenase (short-subunit alcohol dehydrogenase family)
MPGRYAEAHKKENYNGPGDARPTGLQIIQDEDRRGDLLDKVVVITGCSSGIGISTAVAMAATGATVYCTARDLDKAKRALGDLVEGNPKVHLLYADLTSLASIKALADEIKKRETKINILINNAGVMYVPEKVKTKDGFELQIGTNHFAHFFLFCQLRDHLLAGSTPDFNSRVINISSMGHRASPVLLDDINLDKHYDPFIGYSQSKTANIHMVNHLDRLYGSRGIHGYSLSPGGIVTDLQKHVQDMMDDALKDGQFSKFFKSIDQGCATTVWAAVARELEGKGGLYLEDCAVAEKAGEDLDEAGDGRVEPGYAKWAYDPESEEKLWKLSLGLVDMPADMDDI